MPPASALQRLVDVMRDARRPWWVIGSLAVVAHGGATSVADVDVLLDPDDAESLDRRSGLGLTPGVSDGRFRSALYGRWTDAGFPIEFMAGLTVSGDGSWTQVRPVTRVARVVAGVALPMPERGELVEILRLFGRPKDLMRADLLEVRDEILPHQN